MNIYIDEKEKPTECWNCPCFKNDIECNCGLDDGTNDYFLDEIDGGECPLKTIQSVQNKKASEYLEELSKRLKKHFKYIYGNYFAQKEDVETEILAFILELKGEKI